MTKIQLFEDILARTTKTGVPMPDQATKSRLDALDSKKIEKTIKRNMIDQVLNNHKTHSDVFKYLIEIERFDKPQALEYLKWLSKEETKYF